MRHLGSGIVEGWGQVLLALCVLAFVGVSSSPVALAQTHPDAHVKRVAAERVAAERVHLRRVAWWGGVSLVVGAGLYSGARRDGLRAFGMQTALWGGINTAIGVLARPNPVADSWSGTVADERFLSDVLLLNTGLNVAYIATGGALIAASYYGVRQASQWRGHGAAVAVQGALLLLLDGVALLAARSRLDALLGIAGDLAALPLPSGVGVVWVF